MIKLCFDTTVPLTYIIYSFFSLLKKTSDSHAVNLYDWTFYNPCQDFPWNKTDFSSAWWVYVSFGSSNLLTFIDTGVTQGEILTWTRNINA